MLTCLRFREEFQLYDPASGGASAKMSSIDAIRYDLVKNKAFDFSVSTSFKLCRFLETYDILPCHYLGIRNWLLEETIPGVG